MDDNESDRDEAARLEKLAAALIHRFNNVLLAIQPHVEVIKRAGKDNERVLGSATQIETALRRARTMMSDVRALAHPLLVDVEPLNVDGWFESLREDVQPFTAQSPIDLTFEAEPDLIVSANREQLTRAVVSLVANAAESLPQGGAIAVTARAVPSGIEIEVADNGMGIAPEVMERAFEPLFTTKRNSSGLGLAIVRQIVDAHGGTVDLQSTVGTGTRVTIILSPRR